MERGNHRCRRGAKQGLLPLEIANNGIRSMVFYTTGDGGRTWTNLLKSR
ncbi:hypothetical protein [Paenibacillus sp. NFR01]|nr:hypothetical protein [Paenibacillus sp. NFR01]